MASYGASLSVPAAFGLEPSLDVASFAHRQTESAPSDCDCLIRCFFCAVFLAGDYARSHSCAWRWCTLLLSCLQTWFFALLKIYPFWLSRRIRSAIYDLVSPSMD